VLEAGASALPVIATRHAGIAEAVIDGTTGYLVDERDVSGMAERIVRLARDPALAQRLGVAGREHVERSYSSEIAIRKLSQVLWSAANP
jgi:glycosyltransferase involved in cell wall biosynthesis